MLNLPPARQPLTSQQRYAVAMAHRFGTRLLRVRIEGTIRGPCDIERLRSAVATVYESNPLLRSRLQFERGEAVLVPTDDQGELHVVAEGESSAQGASFRQLLEAERTWSGRLCRIVLWRRSMNEIELGLDASPIVLDIPGATRLLHLIARAVDGGFRAEAEHATATENVRTDTSARFERAAWFEEAERSRAAWPAELEGAGTPAELAEGRAVTMSLEDLRGAVSRRAVETDRSRADVLLYGLHAALRDELAGHDMPIFVSGSAYDGPGHEIGLPLSRYVPVFLDSSRTTEADLALQATAEKVADALRRLPYYDAGALQNLGGLQSRDFCGAASFEILSLPSFSIGGAAFVCRSLRATTTPFALRCVFSDLETDLSLQLVSDTGRLPVARLEALAGSIRRSLERLVGPDWRAAPRSIDARTAVLRGPDAPEGVTCVHEAFFEHAKQRPEAVAVVHDGKTTTYHELARSAAAVARGLARAGVGRHDVVALYQDNGTPLLASMLGVMAIGAAFLPLDYGSLSRWTESIVRDAKVRVVVTTSELVSRFAELEALSIERLIEDRTSDPPPTSGAEADDVAYVIYTSGSTGTPRGVAVAHRSLRNYAQWAARTYGLAQGTGVLWHSSVAFDMSVTSTLVPLSVGQTVLPMLRADVPARLGEMIKKSHDLSMLKVTPSHFRALSASISPDDWARVRTLVLGGEVVQSDLVRRVVMSAGSTRVFNEYGPTEATVACSAHLITRADLAFPRVPIGVSVDGCTLYVVDDAGSPVTRGAEGQLVVAGVPVAKGYLTQPANGRTAFGQYSCGGESARAYWTGDVVRFRDDGALEFVGRRDDEVKHNGYRVSCEEVSSALRTLPGVADAWAAIVGVEREATLVGYVVPRDRSLLAARDRGAALASALRKSLRDLLPAYMIPGRMPLVPEMPRKSSGKLDEDALARMAARQPLQTAATTPPENERQRVLCAVYQSVLGVDAVGIDDNYFALGGDSIRSIRVAARATASGLRLSVTDVQTHPTVRSLAALLEGRTFAQVGQSEPFSLVPEADRARLPPDVEDAYPLNLLQEGMIYHRSFAPRSAVYHAILSLRLRAPFDLEAMRTTVRALVARHPLLRTQFDLTNFSVPLQLVHSRFGDSIQYENLESQSERQQAEAIWGWIQREKERGFDVDAFPLIRFALHKLADDHLQLTFSYHHEIVDGWSEALMVSEVISGYMQRVAGVEPVAANPTVTFRDAIALERGALDSEEHARFWREYLSEATFMRLPRFHRPRADKGERLIIKRLVPVDRDISEGIRSLSRGTSVPIKTLLLASHFRVMSHFGGTPDVVTHTVSNGRPEDVDGSQLIGLFVNSLTLRAQLPGGTWRELVDSILKREQETLPFRRYPMAEVKRHQGSEPLSETLFIFTDYHVYDGLRQWPNLELESIFVYGESTFPFCAGFRVHPLTGAVELQLEYDSLQFGELLMDSVAYAFQQALRSMVRSLDERYDAVPLIAPGEEERLVAMQGRDAPGTETAEVVHRVIERRARAYPGRVAAVDVSTGRSLSYRALHAGAEAVAANLLARGVGPETVVLVYMHTSPELLVAILGVLKAGAAFMALDPQHGTANVERARAAFGVRYAVVSEGAPLDESSGLEVLRVADPPATRARANVTCRPDQLAYVVFTSGSSAGPKAVAVSHRALVAATMPREAFYGDDYQRFLLLSSHAFDSAFAGVFGTLFHGGTLLVASRDTRQDLVAITAAIRDHSATHTLCIPSLWASVLETSPSGALDSLRSVAVAGETCSRGVYELHRERAPRAAFANEYGPSETTVWATAWSSKTAAGPLEDAPPIGRPIDGVRVEVFDAHRAAAPIGVPGELCITGTTLARGYLDSPRETARAFAPAAGGRRMYRTGDVARFDASGHLNFLGRADGQVKVNGFRVQPAEVESALETHPAVDRAIVVVGGGNGRAAQLLAFVTQRAGATVTAAALVAFAKSHLPKYLIPSRISVLQDMPLTKAGKVDRKALPALAALSTTGAAGGGPGTKTEEAVIAIWREVLDTQEIRADSDFFELGGDSLRAMRVLARVAKVFGRKIPVQELMGQASTVRSLSDYIETRSG